jgi:hypothetical protein
MPNMEGGRPEGARHQDITVDDLTRRTAVEWRRERDQREPLKRDLEAERKARTKEFVLEALEPAADDLDACLRSLANDDIAGSAHHFRRVILALKHAAPALRELAPTATGKAA